MTYRKRGQTLLLHCLAVGFLLVLPISADPSTNGSSASPGQSQMLQSLLTQINEFRQSRGLNGLKLNPLLGKAAEQHSIDMATLNFFDHKNLKGEQPHDRTARYGYRSAAISENLFMCMGTPPEEIARQCLDSWIESPGHLRSLVDPRRLDIGLGAANNADDETYITAVFGTP